MAATAHVKGGPYQRGPFPVEHGRAHSEARHDIEGFRVHSANSHPLPDSHVTDKRPTQSSTSACPDQWTAEIHSAHRACDGYGWPTSLPRDHIGAGGYHFCLSANAPIRHTPWTAGGYPSHSSYDVPYRHDELPGPAVVSILPQRRRRERATQACLSCRKRKRACDERLPSCFYCEKEHLKCERQAPMKIDENMKRLLHFGELIDTHRKELSSKLDSFNMRLGRVEEQSQFSTSTPSASEDGEPPRQHPELDGPKTAAHLSVLQWPVLRPQLIAANVKYEEGYVTEAEDRGMLMRDPSKSNDENADRHSTSKSQASVEARPSTPRANGDRELGMFEGADQRQSCGTERRNVNAGIDLDEGTIDTLRVNYLRHIHNMHPFLDERQLRRDFDKFIELNGSGRRPIRSARGSDSRPLKRQCSTDLRMAVVVESGEQVPLERSPQNAIVYLVMALGEICSHREPLPAFVDMDAIPGMAYYTKAAEIMGDQGDGNDLVHAQMFLLAGLYKGQLARVKESMSWITMAGRAILILLDRYKLYNDNYWTADGDVRRRHETAQKRIEDTRQSLIVMASWTCLQLESDILAELKLPSSGIQNFENLLLMPQKPEDEAHDGLELHYSSKEHEEILIYYTAQLFLRRRLNQVHRELYGSECLGQSLPEVQEVLLGHDGILTTWREGLPSSLRWKDDDPPSSDILAARLRAKYYGAQYIINRLFLDYVLHIKPWLSHRRSVEQVARRGDGSPRDRADIHIFEAIAGLEESAVREGARRCVIAAIHSTTAFDRVPGRLIVTNIHGTSHAQFGNVLVLIATSNTDHTRELVEREVVRQLLQRTIAFLRNLAQISPTAAADRDILKSLKHSIFPSSSDEACASISCI